MHKEELKKKYDKFYSGFQSWEDTKINDRYAFLFEVLKEKIQSKYDHLERLSQVPDGRWRDKHYRQFLMLGELLTDISELEKASELD